MRYFLILDSKPENNILAIHKTHEAAILAFQQYIESDEYVNYLELRMVQSNEFGIVNGNVILRSHSKASNQTMEYQLLPLYSPA